MLCLRGLSSDTDLSFEDSPLDGFVEGWMLLVKDIRVNAAEQLL